MTTGNVQDKLATKVLIGLVAGVVLGLLVRLLAGWIPGLDKQAEWVAVEVLQPFGTLFLRLLFLVVIPLVFASLALGVSSVAGSGRLGGLSLRTFGFFLVNMAVGTFLGLLFMNLVAPGAGFPVEIRDALLADGATAGQAARIQENARLADVQSFSGLLNVFLPQNMIGAIVGSSPDKIGNLLALIFLALLTGMACTRLEATRRRTLEGLFEAIGDVSTTIVGWAMRLAPYAVAALVGAVVVRFGWDYLRALAWFTGGVLLVIAIHMFGTLSILVRVFGKRAPSAFFSAVRVVLVTAFSTSSSSATLPTTIAVARERLGVSKEVSGFVLPLGATLNMSGSALYEGCVVLFLAQVFGVQLDLGQQILLVLMAVSSAVAVAGIPGGTLPFIVGLLATFGIPAEGIALVLGVDRLLDMSRTTLNVAGDLAVACMVDRQERT